MAEGIFENRFLVRSFFICSTWNVGNLIAVSNTSCFLVKHYVLLNLL